jgi:hypothetical protein
MTLEDPLTRLAGVATELSELSGVTVFVVQPVSQKLRLRERIVDPDLLKVSEGLFEDGHHARAVEEVFKYLNNLVKTRSGRADLDGASLTKTALSANSPVLKLNAGATQSERDEQLGYMEIFAGSTL